MRQEVFPDTGSALLVSGDKGLTPRSALVLATPSDPFRCTNTSTHIKSKLRHWRRRRKKRPAQSWEGNHHCWPIRSLLRISRHSADLAFAKVPSPKCWFSLPGVAPSVNAHGAEPRAELGRCALSLSLCLSVTLSLCLCLSPCLFATLSVSVLSS